MKIRRAGPAELAAVHALAQQIPEAPHWTLEQYESLVAQPDSFLFVAEEDGLVGFAAVSVLNLLGEAVAQLESIAVSPARRGEGIGLRLLRHTILKIAVRSSGVMELEVRSQNEAAIALYTKAGFAVQGARPSYYTDPPDDAVLMALHFPQAPIAG